MRRAYRSVEKLKREKKPRSVNLESAKRFVENANSHATRQSVGRSRVDQLASLLVLVVLVDVDSQDGSEDLVDHRDRLGVLREDDGRLDVETGRVVSRSTENDFSSGFLGLVDVRDALVVRSLGAVCGKREQWSAFCYRARQKGENGSHDGTHEVLELVDGTESDLLEFLNEGLLEKTLALPKLLGNVKTGESRAFLT